MSNGKLKQCLMIPAIGYTAKALDVVSAKLTLGKADFGPAMGAYQPLGGFFSVCRRARPDDGLNWLRGLNTGYCCWFNRHWGRNSGFDGLLGLHEFRQDE
jgi:hypothetical protein